MYRNQSVMSMRVMLQFVLVMNVMVMVVIGGTFVRPVCATEDKIAKEKSAEDQLTQEALAYMPAKTLALICLCDNPVLQKDALGIEKTLGFKPQVIERAYLFLSVLNKRNLGQSEFLAFIRTKTPVVDDKLMERLPVVISDKLTQGLVIPNGPSHLSIRILDEKTFLIGAPALVKLEPKPIAQTVLTQKIKGIDLSKSLTLIMDPSMFKLAMPMPLYHGKELVGQLNCDPATGVTTMLVTVPFKRAVYARQADQILKGLVATQASQSPEIIRSLIRHTDVKDIHDLLEMKMKVPTELFVDGMSVTLQTVRSSISMIRMRKIFRDYFSLYFFRGVEFPKSLGDAVINKHNINFPSEPWYGELPEFREKKTAVEQLEAMTEWINAKSQYCYVPGLKRTRDSRRVLMFERAVKGGMINVLYTDGKGELITVKRADELIKAQTGRSLEAWAKAPNPGSGGK